MKSPADLTELEALKLQLAQIRLKHAAFDYACRPKEALTETVLFEAAREFHRTCDEVGFQDYWPGVVAVDPPPCDT